MQVNAALNQEIEQMDRAIAAMAPFVQAANTWMNDALAHEQVLDNICYLMSDPDFLVFWTSRVWGDRITHDGESAMEWINDEYLKLFEIYDARYVARYGQHSPMWFKLQPKITTPIQGSVDSQNYAQIPPQFQQQYTSPQFQQPSYPPMPPVPGNNTSMGGPIEELKQRIEMRKSGAPDLGQMLQRIHAQNRQSMGADIYV